MRYWWTYPLLMALLLYSCKKENAQLDELIYGTVRDASSGDPIPYANVVFENTVSDGINTSFEFAGSATADANGNFTFNRESDYDYANAAAPGYVDEGSSSVAIDNNYFCRFSIYLRPLATLRLIVRDNPDLNVHNSVTYFLPGQGLSEEYTHTEGMEEEEWNLIVAGDQTYNLYLTWDAGTANETLEIQEVFVAPQELTIYLLEY
jgi:hypothetical protein